MLKSCGGICVTYIFLLLMFNGSITASAETLGKFVKNRFTQDMIDTVINAHNEDRRLEHGVNIHMMRWSPFLADMAQAAADSCLWKHINYKLNERITFGQNIAIFSSNITNKLQKAVNAWYKEHAYYDIERFICKPGKECGHYLAMVKWDASEVGCALKRCSRKGQPYNYWKQFYLLFCNYNAIRRRGQHPYKPGNRCTNCMIEPGWTCNNGLCDKCDPKKESNCTPYTCWKTQEDKLPDCPERKADGWCKKKSRIMAIFCRHTCRICPLWDTPRQSTLMM